MLPKKTRCRINGRKREVKIDLSPARHAQRPSGVPPEPVSPCSAYNRRSAPQHPTLPRFRQPQRSLATLASHPKPRFVRKAIMAVFVRKLPLVFLPSLQVTYGLDARAATPAGSP